MPNWSQQQEAIFTEFRTGTAKVVVVDAKAGTGKTTTILEALNHAPEQEIVCCAFNKEIAEELKNRIKNPCASAKTLHSLGNSIVYARWGKTQIDAHRGMVLAEKAIGDTDAPRDLVKLVSDIASKAKGIAPLATTIEPLMDIAEKFDLTADGLFDDQEQPYSAEQVATFVLKALDLAAIKDGSIDFDDMIFLPLRNNWVRPRYDMVVVDEAQDMNAAQLLLAQGVCKGRLVIVGDPRQGIYGFRGADTGSFERFKTDLGGKVLGLTITYRCPKAVVALANTIVSDYQAAPTAPEGVVSNMSSKQLLSSVKPGDFVLSRSNAPLATICLKLLRNGTKAVIRGRKDIGLGLLKLIEKQKARDIPSLLKKMELWVERSIKAINASKLPDESKIAFVYDQAETIAELATGLTGIAELKTRMETLFSDNDIQNAVVCSSVHKAKGLEAEKVFVLASTLFPGKRKNVAEENIAYVAYTRAKSHLVLVEGRSF